MAEQTRRSRLPAPPGRAAAAPSGRPTTEPFWALRDVSLEVAPRRGRRAHRPNGAGKSTLLKLLSRITLPTEGRIELRGRDGLAARGRAPAFTPSSRGARTSTSTARSSGLSRREIASRYDEIVEFSGVEAFIDTPVKRYSSGMFVRLGFAVAAHLEPEIMLVDEVLAVGDTAFQRKCMEKIAT